MPRNGRRLAAGTLKDIHDAVDSGRTVVGVIHLQHGMTVFRAEMALSAIELDGRFYAVWLFSVGHSDETSALARVVTINEGGAEEEMNSFEVRMFKLTPLLDQ